MTEPRPKLIFCWTYREWGGAQIYFIAIMKLAAAEWDVSVILPRSSSPEIVGYIEDAGAQVQFIDTFLDLAAAPTIRRKLERQWSRISSEIKTLAFLRRYDLSRSVLHIETSPWQSWILLTLLSLRRANVFVTLHNAPSTPQRWRNFVWKLRMQFVSRLPGFHIFTSNKDTKNRIRHLVSPKFWDDIAVTYTCVDPVQIEAVARKKGARSAARQLAGINEDAFVVLAVGQFIDRKGRWVFLDAAKLLQDQDIHFLWLSPSLPDNDAARRIGDYGLGDKFRIIISSTVGGERVDILSFFKIADVFALPSYIEGLPIALLEAMSLGVPSVSTNVYAIPEAVIHAQTGILIEPGDAGALAEAIQTLRRDPGLRAKLCEEGSEFVLRNFDEREASRIAIARYRESLNDA